jgi:hypothetical protein
VDGDRDEQREQDEGNHSGEGEAGGDHWWLAFLREAE